MIQNFNNFNIEKFKKHLKTKEIGKRLFYFDKIDSTNEYASILIKNSINDSMNKNTSIKNINGSLILAEEQTKGRGKRGNKWHSEKGGLWFTIIIVNNIEQKILNNIVIIMAVSIVSALKEHTGYEFSVKWPNDIYFCNKKVGGILTEISAISGQLNYISIGAGININNNFKTLNALNNQSLMLDNTNYELASLKTLFKKDFEREKILGDILNNFEKNYKYYLNKNDLDSIMEKINYRFLF